MSRSSAKRSRSSVEGTTPETLKIANCRPNPKLKILPNDNGTEIRNDDFDEYLCRRGIMIQKKNPHTPKQNGLAEQLELREYFRLRQLIQHCTHIIGLYPQLFVKEHLLGREQELWPT